MGRRLYICVYMLAVGLCATGQRNEGDACVDGYTNSAGRCTATDRCKSARDDFEKNGIQPTFCQYNTFGRSLVCCRNGVNIVQPSPTTPAQRPVWGTSSAGSRRKRLSERKCEEYSRDVVQQTDYIPLVPDPEPLTVTAALCAYSRLELIVGGEDAAQGEFPHMAAIGWANFQGGFTFLCGGSLISPRFVLSAGHCLSTVQTTLQNAEPSIVRLGDQNLNPAVNDGADPFDVPIRKAHPHPQYNSPIVYNDIALFELARDAPLSAGVRPACLWTRDDFAGHTKAIATGWGVTDPLSQKTSDELKKVALSLLTNEYCDPLLQEVRNRKWRGFIPSQMCAGELRGGMDTCQGDSGSPLQVVSKDNQCIYYVMGVTSFGRRCAESGMPAVYTRVASYIDWIEQTVWPGEQ